MWIHEPDTPCPQRDNEDAILNLEPDPVFVSGVTGKYSQALDGEYLCDGTFHNDRPLFRKVNGSILLLFDNHNLWAFSTKHTLHTSNDSLAIGVTKYLPHPHREVKWRTFVDKDTWGVCPSMSCTSFTPGSMDDAQASIDDAQEGTVTSGESCTELSPSTPALKGNSRLSQTAPKHVCHTEDGAGVLADLMLTYASPSPSPSPSPTIPDVVSQVLNDSESHPPSPSPTNAVDSSQAFNETYFTSCSPTNALEPSQVFNETNASMPTAMHADFDLLRKLPFFSCDLKNRRAQTFLTATAAQGVPACHIGQLS